MTEAISGGVKHKDGIDNRKEVLSFQLEQGQKVYDQYVAEQEGADFVRSAVKKGPNNLEQGISQVAGDSIKYGGVDRNKSNVRHNTHVAKSRIH